MNILFFCKEVQTNFSKKGEKSLKVTLQSYGACNEVTGSKHFLKINGKYILIDYRNPY